MQRRNDGPFGEDTWTKVQSRSSQGTPSFCSIGRIYVEVPSDVIHLVALSSHQVNLCNFRAKMWVIGGRACLPPGGPV